MMEPYSLNALSDISPTKWNECQQILAFFIRFLSYVTQMALHAEAPLMPYLLTMPYKILRMNHFSYVSLVFTTGILTQVVKLLVYILEKIEHVLDQCHSWPSISKNFTSFCHVIGNNSLFCVMIWCKQMNQQIIVN
jgi:hypothetical protein